MKSDVLNLLIEIMHERWTISINTDYLKKLYPWNPSEITGYKKINNLYEVEIMGGFNFEYVKEDEFLKKLSEKRTINIDTILV
jgi:hypothetical protein